MKYNLSYLLENKPFERLTTQEKTFVLSILNETEYKLQRTIILQGKNILTDTQNSLIPTVPIKALNELHKKQKANKKPFMVVLFNPNYS